MNIYIINRDVDIERWLEISSRVQHAVRIPAVPIDNPTVLEIGKNIVKAGINREIILKEISNRLSFCKALQNAKDNGDSRCIVLEDDCVFEEDLNILKNDIDRLPDDFGLFYLGYYIKKLSTGILVPFADKILEASGSFYIWGAHAIVYNNLVFNPIIEGLSRHDAPITDLFMSMKIIPKFRCFFRYPVAVHQKFDTKGSMHEGMLNFREYSRDNDKFVSDRLVASLKTE